ncbi:ABC transporter permease [Streptomyces sp. 3MP-14]|uniref:ABC transporter permease n=1 Tax=Streptomyces mimosae TaxID=2586635 RepID=A0A5N6A0V2_9ACTN|nr:MULTISPECIES: ABC transporter permease [Streptomyces]KAB8161832.1 ABC transporter permease [Streptomyces mimosae]KAB8174900.1 ABC transporter permease [Streptomyces sp. 3MP-14]
MTTLSHFPRHGIARALLRLHRVPLLGWAALVVAGAAALTRGDELRNAQLLAWLPCAVAACLGAALIGRELERGTATLAWTQSVTPARWLAAKLAVPAAALLGGTAALTALFRWSWLTGPDNGVNRWNSEYFHAAGPVGPAYVLLGLALGALAALLTRRTLPAAGLALGGIWLAYHLGDRVRSSLWPANEVRGPWGPELNHVDQVEFGMILESGERASGLDCGAQAAPGDLATCLADHGAVDFYASIHPTAHYWPIQLVETAIILTLAAATTAATFRTLRRRLP